MSGSSQLTPNSLDLATESYQQVVVSLPDDILENYKEAVINYSKVWIWIICGFICLFECGSQSRKLLFAEHVHLIEDFYLFYCGTL